RLKEKSGGRVIALTAGPKRTEQMLREALAKGADEVARIAFDEPAAYDVGKVARLLAAAIRTLPHDLVLTGVQSDDLVNSATRGAKGHAGMSPGTVEAQAKKLAQLLRDKGFARR